MKNRGCGRFIVVPLMISLLAAGPAYGAIPVVSPLPVSDSGSNSSIGSGTGRVEVGVGPGDDLAGGLETGTVGTSGPGQNGAEGENTYPGAALTEGPGIGQSGVTPDQSQAGPGGSQAAPGQSQAGPGGNQAVPGGSQAAPGGNQAAPGQGWAGGPGESSGNAGAVRENRFTTLTQPTVASQGAVVMDADSGQLLYSKNAESRYYPASITKLLTALLTVERCNLDDTVTFSRTATTNLESGAVTLGLVEGDQLTVRQCLYALLLKSANEVANGLAEHISGSVSEFSGLMNARAKELGCFNSNFANPNGLNNSNHYTTPHDMALIARAAFRNPMVCEAASTLSYQIPATKKAGARTISLGHKMLYPNDSRYYPGIIGGKTGYTSLAGNTLVTCAQQNGVRLIVVIMKSRSTQYADTKALLDYGFALKKTGGSVAHWVEEGKNWYLEKPDGSRASNEWLTVDGVEYWFDSNRCMATGWRQFTGGIWYYFHSNGAMAVNQWVESNGTWFYLGQNGQMMKNTVTPDGYRLDESGAWTGGAS